MLRQSYRLTGDQVRKVILGSSRVFHTAFFTIKLQEQENLEKSRFSVVIAKKQVKLAVDRNHIRRQIYSLIRTYKTRPGNYILFLKKKGQFLDFKADLDAFFKK